MKKFLLFLALALAGAMWNSVDARWVLGEQKNASQIQVGDTIVLEFCTLESFLGRYLAGSELTATGVLADENIYLVEEGPLDVRTGAPTILLKQHETNSYLCYPGGNGQTGKQLPMILLPKRLQTFRCSAVARIFHGQTVFHGDRKTFSGQVTKVKPRYEAGAIPPPAKYLLTIPLVFPTLQTRQLGHTSVHGIALTTSGSGNILTPTSGTCMVSAASLTFKAT